MSDKLELRFVDSESKNKLETQLSNFVPYNGDVVFLEDNRKFLVDSKIISYSKKRVIIYGTII
jgi:hypothetical protein